jgi:hypothetical protein
MRRAGTRLVFMVFDSESVAAAHHDEHHLRKDGSVNRLGHAEMRKELRP